MAWWNEKRQEGRGDELAGFLSLSSTTPWMTPTDVEQMERKHIHSFQLDPMESEISSSEIGNRELE